MPDPAQSKCIMYMFRCNYDARIEIMGLIAIYVITDTSANTVCDEKPLCVNVSCCFDKQVQFLD